MNSATRRTAFLLATALAAASSSAIASDGFLSPGAGEALAPGSIVEVRWTPVRDTGLRGVDEVELVLSLDGGTTFPIRVTPDMKPGASRFLWKVPALPTSHARLALRAGEDERDATETVEIVSRDFRILPEPDGRVAELKRRAAEWFVPFEPGTPSAEDLLEPALVGPRAESGAAPAVADATLTRATRPAGGRRSDTTAGEFAGERREAPVLTAAVSGLPPLAPIPLRL